MKRYLMDSRSKPSVGKLVFGQDRRVNSISANHQQNLAKLLHVIAAMNKHLIQEKWRVATDFKPDSKSGRPKCAINSICSKLAIYKATYETYG